MFANVAIAVPLHQLFTYKIPGDLKVEAGMRVIAPFRKKQVVGYVIEKFVSLRVCEFAGLQNEKIKDILEAPDIEPVFSQSMLKFLMWLADYYCSPIGEVCRAALPPLLNKLPPKKKKGTVPILKGDCPFFLFPLQNGDCPFFSKGEVELTKFQTEAYNGLKDKIQNAKFSTTLLHGITGSGKTEIYLKLFSDCLLKGKDAIYLIPEIGLAPQTANAVLSRFGKLTAVYHSSLSNIARKQEWEKIRGGSAKIAVGTRSAIFAPFKNLGLIVIDEEHDTSYKQEESPRYNARDAGVMRAKLENIPCILGSATPSLESFYNARIKKYHYIHLPERPLDAVLPDVEAIDMRENSKGSKLSPSLISAITETISKKEQAMLYLNRRGFATFTMCKDCGHVYECPNCTISLIYHNKEKLLRCHYCDYKISLPSSCHKCQSKNVSPFGTGTEKIEEEITKIFPKANIARLDSDTAGKKGFRTKVLSGMKRGEVDILIGTQMITKGHDFPNVSLVGIIDADTSINFPDFRSAERTFQLVTQAAGRAGRGDKKGRVIIQTYSPEHYSITTSLKHSFFDLYTEEEKRRKELSYPPFGRLLLINIQGANEERVINTANAMAKILKQAVSRQPSATPTTNDQRPTTLLGPAPAPLSKIRNKYRWQILIKSLNINELRKIINKAVEVAKGLQKGVKVIIDVDPVNML